MTSIRDQIGAERRQEDDEAKRLEHLYRNTWLCSACGYRNPLSVSTCPCGDADVLERS